MSIEINMNKSQYKVLSITQEDLDRGWMDLSINSKTPISVFYKSKETKPESNQNENYLNDFTEDDSISNSYYISGSKIYFKPEASYGTIDPETIYILKAYDVETYTYFFQKGALFYKYKDDVLEEFFSIDNNPIVEIYGMNKVFVKVLKDDLNFEIHPNRGYDINNSFTHIMKQGTPTPITLPTATNYDDARGRRTDVNGDYYIYSVSGGQLYKLGSESENFELHPKIEDTLPSYVILNGMNTYSPITYVQGTIHPDDYNEVLQIGIDYINNNLAELQTNEIPHIRNGYQFHSRRNIVLNYTINEEFQNNGLEGFLQNVSNHVYTSNNWIYRFYYNNVEDLPPFLQDIFNDIPTYEDIAISEKLHLMYSPSHYITDGMFTPLNYKTSEFVETNMDVLSEFSKMDLEFTLNLEPPYKGWLKTLDYYLNIDYSVQSPKGGGAITTSSVNASPTSETQFIIDKSIKILSGAENFKHLSYLKTNTGKIVPIYWYSRTILPPIVNLDTEKKSFTYENMDFQAGDKLLIKYY